MLSPSTFGKLSPPLTAPRFTNHWHLYTIHVHIDPGRWTESITVQLVARNIVDLGCLKWRVSKLIFARAENKLFLVRQSEEPDGCQLPHKLMGYMKGTGLLHFVLRRALRERASPRIVSNRRCTMLAKLNTYTNYFILQQVLVIDG